jgi:hypothetical protein
LKRFRLLRTRRMRPSSRRAADNRVPNDHFASQHVSAAPACRCALRQQVCFPPDCD